MFDITAQFVNDQEEIHGLDKIHWGKNSWRQLSLIGDKTFVNLQRTKGQCLLRFCVVPREDPSTSRNPTKLGRTELQGSKPREATEIMMLSVERRQNSSGIFSQGSQRCSSVIKSVIF